MDSFKSLTRPGSTFPRNTASALMAGNQQRRSLSLPTCARLPCASSAQLSPFASYSISAFSWLQRRVGALRQGHSRTFHLSILDVYRFSAVATVVVRACVPLPVRTTGVGCTLSCARFRKLAPAREARIRIIRELALVKGDSRKLLELLRPRAEFSLFSSSRSFGNLF